MKPAQFNKSKIKAATQQALMAADPAYFSWSTEQQQNFRANIPIAAFDKAKRVLLAKLFDIQCTLEEADDIWCELPLDKLNLANWARLLITGIGEDYIYLNEYLADHQSLLDYTTLYDYDHGNYLTRLEAISDEDAATKQPDYMALQCPIWVRLLVKDEFYYGTLMSLASHFCHEVESAGNDMISKLIPHDYVAGE